MKVAVQGRQERRLYCNIVEVSGTKLPTGQEGWKGGIPGGGGEGGREGEGMEGEGGRGRKKGGREREGEEGIREEEGMMKRRRERGTHIIVHRTSKYTCTNTVKSNMVGNKQNLCKRTVLMAHIHALPTCIYCTVPRMHWNPILHHDSTKIY